MLMKKKINWLGNVKRDLPHLRRMTEGSMLKSGRRNIWSLGWSGRRSSLH
jgi:hypothetical protein